VNRPTSAGSTGTIKPTASMSISTTSMMKRIAAGRPAAMASGGTLGRRRRHGGRHSMR
jgi:hypothetical protein